MEDDEIMKVEPNLNLPPAIQEQDSNLLTTGMSSAPYQTSRILSATQKKHVLPKINILSPKKHQQKIAKKMSDYF